MTAELQALLTVQDDDERIGALRRELEALIPREQQLEREVAAEVQAAERAKAELAAEDARRAALAQRVAEHRRMHERNVAQLDQVKRLRDATAAQAQVEMARRILADEEAELGNLDRRMAGLRERIAAHEVRRVEVLEAQRPAREEIARARGALQERIEELQRTRDEKARGIPRDLLHKYERIRKRARGRAVYALRGLSCGACDTAIPLQRRNAMIAGAIDVCEACGVLLYAAPAAPEQSASPTVHA